MKKRMQLLVIISVFLSGSLWAQQNPPVNGARIYQTSKSGDNMADKGKIAYTTAAANGSRILFTLNPDVKYQSIMGFGAAFTEASAYLYSKLSKDKKKEFIDAYFSTNGAAFSMMRTHMGSCDFALSSYSYDEVDGDTQLKRFSIDHDKKWLLPLIKDAKKAPGADFKLFSSPWTPPAWMKDNKSYVGSYLTAKYYPVYSKYFIKYLKAYKKEGIDIWGLTMQNEPAHAGAWDSCHFNPGESMNFIKKYLGPDLAKEKMDVKIMIYDHNKDNILEWAYTFYQDPLAAKYVWGTAFHWYDTFYMVGQEGKPHYNFDAVAQVHNDFPDKHLMHTEGCTFFPVKNYWELSYDWTGYQHIPAERYGVDIIGDLNSWTEGWVEWNLLLNTDGLPNHASNANCAPMMMNESNLEITSNPSFYILEQFSKFIRPGAERIEMNIGTNAGQLATVVATAFKNKNGKIVIEMLNTNDAPYDYQIRQSDNNIQSRIEGHALQTIVLD